MPEYQLYCFAQSGNAYRAALMLNLIGADWQPTFVDFFKGGETRTPKYRADINEMGEVPVLEHEGRRLTQSGVILDYLAERTGQKIVLQRQLSDLGMEHRQIHRRHLAVAATLRAKQPGCPVEKLRLPLGDLVGMNVELLS